VAYDEQLAGRIRSVLASERGVAEKRMFGGLAFLVAGNLAVSASGQGGLLVRVDPDESHALADGVHVQPMEMRGRTMHGWLRVDADTVASNEALAAWVARGVAFARSLPRK
jgi:hypothetical protein